MATTTINGNSSGSGTGYNVLVNNGLSIVTITDSSGTFQFSDPVSYRMNLIVPTSAANITVQNSTFNRQVDVYCYFKNQTITFDNITSYSEPLDDVGINIVPEAGTDPRIFFKQTQFYVTNFNGPYRANGARTVFPASFPSYIYLAYANDTVSLNKFTYTLNNTDMFSKCIVQVGIPNPDPAWPPVVVRINPDDGVTSIFNILQIVGDVTITGTSFKRQVNVTVSAGKTLTFNKCVLSEYHSPGTQDTTLPDAVYDPYILSYNGPGMITFNNNTIIVPRITQSKQVNSEAIINFVAGNLDKHKVTSDSTVLIRHLPSTYDDYDSLYNNIPYVKSATIDVATGSYVFGQAGTKPVTFDMNFAANDTTVTTTDAEGVETTRTTTASAYVVLNVDGGNITYANNTTLVGGGIVWNGYVIGSNNQVGGRSYVFNTSNVLDISGGLIVTANAGNNILGLDAIQGTWTGDVWFSYYPNTSVDYSYNLMLENPLIVGTSASPLSVPLYNGPGSYWYNFYADNTYRPNLYFGIQNDARFDLSAGSTSYINLKNSTFYKGVDLTVNTDQNITSYNSSYYAPPVSGSSCITLSGAGSFTLNFNDSTVQNDLYLNDDLNKIINNQNSATVLVDYNRYHFAAGEWDFNAAGLTTYKSYISTSDTGANDTTGRKGTICLNGSYAFANIPDKELNFLTEGSSTVTGSTFTQSIYVWGSNNLSLNDNIFQGLRTAIFNGDPDLELDKSSVHGAELVNLNSLNGNREFTGTMYLNGTNKFYLPHGKKCISPFGAVSPPTRSVSVTQVILTSYRYSYFIDGEQEPLAYYLGVVYLDNLPASDVTIFGSDSNTAVNKEFTVRTIGTTADQYLTGRFSRLNVETVSSQKVILGVPLLFMGRNTESGLKVLYVDGGYDSSESINTYALDLVGGSSANIDIENVSFINPGSFAYFRVGATERIDFTSTSNEFNNNEPIATKHVGFLESVGSNAILDLGDETFPTVSWNQFFWPTLGNATNAQPLLSSQGYVAESWTNDFEYYDPEASYPTMYFQNVTGGLSKPNSTYGLDSWTAGQNVYDDLFFKVAFGLTGTNTLEVSLNHVANFETYVAGAIYDTDTLGVKTKSYTGTQYTQTIRLRFKDDFANLAQNSRLVTATFAQGGSDLWNVAPVPLKYYIDSQVSPTNYTLTTEYSTNGGSSWYVPNSTDIVVSDSCANGTANVHFAYKNGSDVLRFLYDTSMTFNVDISFIAVGPDTDLNNYSLSWPALQTSSNTLEIRPLPYAGSWTQKQVTVTQTTTNDQTAFIVNNVNDDSYLLVSDTSTFTGVNTTLDISVGNAVYNISTDKYTFTTDFYLMTHVLPPAGTGFDPLVLDASAYINGLAVYPTVTLDVSSTGSSGIQNSDVATPVHVSFSINNSTLLSANTDFSMTLVLDDIRNGSWTDRTQPNPNPNPINHPVTITLNFYIPLYVYLNTSDARYDQNINANISKGPVNDLYVYLNTKLANNYTVDFTLTGDNINKNFSTVIGAGDISATGSFFIAEDNKIWGDAALTLTANVDLVNTVNYTYTEAGTHEVRVLLGRAIGVDGYESSGSDLNKLQYSISTNDSHVRTPLAWDQGDAAGGAFDINKNINSSFIPITKYTPYFVEVEVGSKGFYSNDVNSDLPPKFTVHLTDYLGNTLIQGTDYLLNTTLSDIDANLNADVSLNMTDLIVDTSVNKRIYFSLNPTANLSGDTIGVHIDFQTVDGPSNYDNLNGNSYQVANIDFTGVAGDLTTGNMTSTAFYESAGIRANTWRILPSGDGKYLEFYHDSQPSHYITRLGLDASFHAS